MSKYVDVHDAYSYDTLVSWFIKNPVRTSSTVWTEDQIRELNSEFYVVPRTAHLTESTDPSKIKYENILAGECQRCKTTVNLNWDYCPGCGTALQVSNKLVHMKLVSSITGDED